MVAYQREMGIITTQTTMPFPKRKSKIIPRDEPPLNILLDDGIHHAGKHVEQLVAELLAKHPPKEVG